MRTILLVDDMNRRIADQKSTGLDVLSIFGTEADAKIAITEQPAYAISISQLL
jgi:hypothetical protein